MLTLSLHRIAFVLHHFKGVAHTAGSLLAFEAAKASITSAQRGEGWIPGLADGGIVPATPGGQLYRIGEGGDDEAVIPLSRRGLGAGSITIQIVQPTIRRDEDVEWMGEQIVSTLRRMGVRG